MTLPNRFLVIIIVAAFLPTTATPHAFAEEAANSPPQARAVALHLIHPDTLTGWDYGSDKPEGWTVKQRRLTGAKNATPLVAGWTFGDFDLKFHWTAGSDGVLQLRLLDVPAGSEPDDNDNSLVIAISATDGCGAIASSGKTIAKGLPAAPQAGAEHSARIVRQGDSLKVLIDDAQASSASVAADRRFGLSLQTSAGEVSIDDPTVTFPLGESLFNGTDLTGWWSQRKQDGWKVEEGELVGQGKGGNYLRSEREFGNFTLSFDYKIKPGGNSGVGIRTPREGWPSGQGMELQILDQSTKGAGGQMSIYKHFAPLARPDKSGQWNHVVIKADGRIITAWVNGELAQHADTSSKPATADKPLKGWVGFQDHGAKTQIRNVFVLDEPDGLGLPQWQPTAAASESADEKP